MNENDRELLEGLQALAGVGPREAPAHIEDRLRARFRKEKRRRNLFNWAPPLIAAACMAGIALLLGMRSEAPQPVAVPSAVVARVTAPAVDEDSDESFYPLPEAEALPAMENAMVVRVQLPVSSLQLMGVPVSEERADASVQADLLLGQDGLARAVRLAQ
ncbi:MAG TPA: hypothetical protein VK708_15240 [Bryobacteraceae bacterium]|jgi:hypothetical protein|nr:hypothetical protein [Bryobacteraceae bacterium]